jgi:hypothetical protein
MGEFSRTFLPDSPPADGSKWIGRVLIAVILGEGMWGLIVSLTNNLLLPFLARNMGGDVQSPLYLGKGDFNIPAVFTAVLELCFAGIAAVIVNVWVNRKPSVHRSRSARISPIPSQSNAPLASPPTPGPVQAAASSSPTATAPSSGQFWSPPEPSSRSQVASPPLGKAKPPKEVIYNSVGEPINPTEAK